MSLIKPKIYSNSFPRQRSGHAAVFHNGTMIIYGGFGEVDENDEDFFSLADLYAEPDEIWCFDIELSKWLCIETLGDGPMFGISGANACVFNDCMVLFAGFQQGLHSRTSTVYKLNLNTYEWQNLTEQGLIEGPIPSERDKFGSWVHGNQIIYFGGFGAPLTPDNGSNGEFCNAELVQPTTGWNNCVCVLDLSDPDRFKWTYPEVKGNKPLPRAAHACTKIGNRGYVFGGRWKTKRLNDMHWLDLDTFEWHTIEYKSNAPCGRSWHSINKLSNESILLYAGLDTNGNPLSDMWVFNIRESTWKEIENVHSRLGEFAPRMWHTAVNTNEEGEVIIFGGCTNSVLIQDVKNHCNMVTVFRANPLSLKHQCIEHVIEYWHILKDYLNLMPYSIQKTIENHLASRREFILSTDDDSQENCSLS